MYNDGAAKTSVYKESETKRNSQVSEELQIQRKLIEELATALDNIERALESVIIKIPNVIEQEEKEELLLVPLATSIRTNNRFIINNIHRIQTLINTIEL